MASTLERLQVTAFPMQILQVVRLQKAAAINAVSSNTGVTATVNATTVSGTAATGYATAIAAGDVLINGVDIGALPQPVLQQARCASDCNN